MSSYYISLKNLSRDDCQHLSKTYIEKNILGKGAYGTVKEICKDIDCNYVLKTIVYDKKKYDFIGSLELSEDYIKKSWLNEIEVLKKLNNCQDINQYKFVPMLYDFWYCKDVYKTYFYIIMEKYDGNLYDFLKKFNGKGYKAVALTKLELLESNLYFIHRECDVCLNDIKLDNILYKQLSDYLFVFVFTDTGNSSITADENCKKLDTERFRRQIQYFHNQLKDL